MKMFRRISFLVLALTMSMVMAISFPLNVLAEGQKQYVEDIVVVYGNDYAEAKTNLDQRSKDDGKTYYPVNNTGFNEEYCTLIGYSTTTDKSKAITDIAMMHMLGKYDDSSKYDEILAEQKTLIHDEVQNMKSAFEYFANKYEESMGNKEDSLARLAYDVLNTFYNDDIKDENGKYVTVAEMILNSDDYSDEQFDTMFMEMNTVAYNTIRRYILIGCMEDWVSAFVELPEKDSDIQFTASETESAQLLLQLLPAFQEDMNTYFNNGYTMKTDEKSLKTYYNSLSNNDDKMFFEKYLAIEIGMTTYNYKDGTLLDGFMQDPTKEGALALLKRVTHCLPDEISGLIGCLDISEMFSLSFNNEKAAEKLVAFRSLAKIDSMTSTSIYTGVDRSVFTNSEGIAVTSNAKRQMETSDQQLSDTLQKDTKAKAKLLMAVCLTSLATFAIGVPCLFFGTSMISSEAAEASEVAITTTFYDVSGVSMDLSSSTIAYFGDTEIVVGAEIETVPLATTSSATTTVASASSVLGYVLVVAAAVIFAATAVVIGLAIWKSIKLKNETPERRAIPRIMVEDVKDSRGFHDLTYYYCAKDSNGNCADINNGYGAEWNALYYTKDTDAGSPLTADQVKVSSNSSEMLRTEQFTPAHAFGEDFAYSMNDFSGKDDTKAYFGFSCEYEEKTTPTTTPDGTATVLTNGTNAIFAAGGLAVGALITLGISSATRKKKAKVSEI